MHYFCIFFKKFNKPFVTFLRVWTKNANCWEILRTFWKSLMKILLKNWIFILFFILFFENLLLKIEPSEITPVFYNNFFGFGGGGNFPPFLPLATPLTHTERRAWKIKTVLQRGKFIVEKGYSWIDFPAGKNSENSGFSHGIRLDQRKIWIFKSSQLDRIFD